MKTNRTNRISNVISGRARDIPARLARSGLRSLEPVYRTITNLRNRSYDLREDRIGRVDVPVISIGNLTTGGTGKTPMVRWVSQLLLDMNEQPAIVSRGYGSQDGQPNDEFMELQLYLPKTTHIQNPDRIAAAKLAIGQHNASIIVLDDGFQHRRIGRDLDIVLVDATCPFGYGHLLPRGLLREPVESLKRADAAVITRVDQVTDQQVSEIRKRISRFVDPANIALARFQSTGWLRGDGSAELVNPASRVVAFCGIGNPHGFQKALASLCLDVIEFQAFADHHDYSQADFDALQSLSQATDAAALICTVKDLVKIRELSTGPVPVLAVSIETKFESGQKMLKDLVKRSIGIKNNRPVS